MAASVAYFMHTYGVVIHRKENVPADMATHNMAMALPTDNRNCNESVNLLLRPSTLTPEHF